MIYRPALPGKRRLPDLCNLAHAAGWELYDLHGLELHSTDPAQHPIWKGEDLDGLDRDLSAICPTCETATYTVYTKRARLKLQRRMAKHGDTLRITREVK